MGRRTEHEGATITAETNEKPLFDINPRTATEEEFARLRAATDDQLRRASHSFDVFPIVESSLRLKDAMQKEERAIKGLTWVLVVLTVVLVGLTFILVRLGYEAVQASTPHDQSNPSSPPR